jgi:hypothetical protein
LTKLIWISLALLWFASSDAQTERRRLGSTGGGTSIAYDNGSQGDQGSGASLTISHVVATDANWMEVGVASYLAGGTQTMAVTYNGTSMTGRTAQGGADQLQTFYLASPATGTHDIVVTPSSSSCEVAVAAISLKTVSATSNPSNGTANNTDWTNTVTCASGNWSVVFLWLYNEAPSVTNGTLRVSNSNTTTQASIYCYTRESSSTTVQVNGTKAGSNTWRTNGASLNK